MWAAGSVAMKGWTVQQRMVAKRLTFLEWLANNGSCGFLLEQSGVLLGHFPWQCDPWICSNQAWFETILEILQAKQYTATNPFLFKSVRMDSVPWIQQPGNTNTDSSMALINMPDPYFLGWFPTSCLRTQLLQLFQTGLMESHYTYHASYTFGGTDSPDLEFQLCHLGQ